MSHFYLGSDVGNNNSEICVLDQHCRCVYADTLPTLAIPLWRELLTLFAGQQLHAAFEIGTHYPWLVKLLREYCCEVVVVNAQAFKQISEAHHKNDRLDAARLALGLWRGDLPEVFVPGDREQEDRRLVAFVHENSKQVSRLKTRLRDLLYANLLRCPVTDLWGLAGQTWLSEALPKLPKLEALMAAQMIEQLKVLEEQRKVLDARVAQRVVQYPEREYLESIPGFGPLIILAALSSLAGIARFMTERHLSSYWGVCGRLHQSGKTYIQGSITKHGNKHVRWLLGQAVTHVIRHDAKVRKRYLRIKRRKGAKVARVAIMRWLATIIWRLLHQQQRYHLNGVPGMYYERKAAKKRSGAKKSQVVSGVKQTAA